MHVAVPGRKQFQKLEQVLFILILLLIDQHLKHHTCK